MKRIIVIFFVLLPFLGFSQNIKIGLLKYNGGGDWYANPTSLSNLIAFSNKNCNTSINPEPEIVEVGSSDLYNYPFIHMTGHGNVIFSDAEALNLRSYLCGGGFLHIDDNYGMDIFIRAQIKKVFPEIDLIELPYDHLIFRQQYLFPRGLPKIHEHDGKTPQAFGIIFEGRLVCLYTYESDLGDGWEDPAVHKDSEETRLKALKMGANIIKYAFIE